MLLASTLVRATSISLDKAFDAYAEKLIEENHVPGLSVAVIDSGDITSRGYGFSELPSTKATADTLYFSGSTTKAFTAAAAGILVEDQDKFVDVKWTTPLINLLPESFSLSNDFATLHTTLEDALSHRSGLPRHDWAFGWGNQTTADIIKTFRHLPLTAEPRTRWQYCNLMFAAVGEAVQRLTRKDLGDVLKDWIWEPLGMISTTFDLRAAKESVDGKGERKLARGYYWVQGSDDSRHNPKNEGYFVPDTYVDLLPHAGAGATISSVNDYALWVKALLSAAATVNSPQTRNESSPVSASLYRTLVSPRMIMSVNSETASQEAFTQPETYALGWEVTRLGSRILVQHGGGIPGFITSVWFFPSDGFGFVSMANADVGSAKIQRLLFKETLKKRFQRSEISEKDVEVFLEGKSEGGMMFSEPQSKMPLHTGTNEHDELEKKSDLGCNPGIKTTFSSLPGSISDYLGVYFHPGYGEFKISFDDEVVTRFGAFDSMYSSQINHQSRLVPLLCDAKNPSFIVTPSPRQWNYRLVLKHKSHTSFTTDMYWVRGPFANDPVKLAEENQTEKCTGEFVEAVNERNLRCKSEVVWEYVSQGVNGKAVFFHGIEDGKVQRLGVEMDHEMTRLASESGNGFGEQFIWFDKRS